MCLATVYSTNKDGQQTLCKNIVDVRMENGKWVFTDIMGNSMRVDAQLECINLMDSFISLKEVSSQ